MRTCWCIALMVAAGFLRCNGAESDFYRSFLSVNTNDALPCFISSPMLIETTNTAPKLSVINLEEFLANGKVGDIRLGMTMDEVVARWGKPPKFYSKCGEGPRFFFKDTSLTFRSNALTRITFSSNTRFNHNLSSSSSLKEWVDVLGTPTKRTQNEYHTYLSFESPGSIIYLTSSLDGEEVYTPIFSRNPNQTNDLH